MKKRMMLLSLAAVFLTAGYGIAEEKSLKDSETPASTVSENQEEAVSYCPICGPEEETHGMALGYKYEGKKYTFCSMNCLKAFKKNPEKFLEEKHTDHDGEHTHNIDDPKK